MAADRDEVGPITLVAVPLVVLVLAWLLVRFVLVPARISRYHAQVAALRWEPAPAGPEHEPHAGLVAELEAQGYAVHSRARLALGRNRPAVTLLGHDDLSVAEVATRSDGLGVSVTSLLADGTCVLETVGHGDVPPVAGRLLQVLPGATVPALVRRHHEALAWLATRGVAVVAHPDGPPGVFETSARILGSAPTPTAREVAALAAGRTPHLGPLDRQDGIDAQLQAAGL